MAASIYLDYFQDVVCEERITLYEDVEKCFSDVDYCYHKDALNSVFTNSEDINSQKACMVNDIYRIHIDSVLGLQGVHLLSPHTDKFSDIVTILRAVCTLATNKPSDIFTPQELAESESACVTMANVVELVTNHPACNVLPLLDYVDDRVVTYIHNDSSMVTLATETVHSSRDRFRASTLEKTGVVVEGIKIFNRFGYSIDSFLKEFGDALENLSAMDLAKEIVLLVLASNTSDKMLLNEMLELSVTLTDGPVQAASTQSYIKSMVHEYVKR